MSAGNNSWRKAPGAGVGGPRVVNVLWISNLPAPYRVPVWQHVAEACDLRVRLFADSHADRDWGCARARDIDISTWRSRRLHRRGVEIYITPRIPIASVLWADTILIGMWEAPICIIVFGLAVLLRRPVCIFYESTQATHRFHSGPVEFIRRFVFTHATAILTPGASATEAVSAMGVPRERIVESFNAVDVGWLHDETSRLRHASLESTEAVSSGHTYIYIGQLIERKNVGALLQAFAECRTPADKLLIVGTGRLAGELRTLVGDLDISGQVEFLGQVPYSGIPAVLAIGQTLVLPSTEEVWGLVVNEALATGLHAVISSKCGVLASVRHMPGVYGAESDAESLGHAMIRSSADFAGYIKDPVILSLGPRRMAADALRALRVTGG